MLDKSLKRFLFLITKVHLFITLSNSGRKVRSPPFLSTWFASLNFFLTTDFTFVCPTEIIAFSDRVEEFRKLNTEVIGISVDSKYTHLAWVNTSRKDGGLGKINIPLVADITKSISTAYDVLLEDGFTLRQDFNSTN